jgi:hypothetical protein
MPWVRRKRLAVVSVLVGALALSGPAATATGGAVSASDVAVITLGPTAATLIVKGKAHAVPKLGRSANSTAVQTQSGVLVIADNILKLIGPTGGVRVLSGKATVDGFAASPAGRYVAWSVSPGSYRDKSPYKVYLYDLAQRRLVHSRVLADQVSPVGILDDGRVALQAQGLSRQSYLWQPRSGALAKVGTKRFPSVDRAVGHLLVLSDQAGACSAMIEDSRTGKLTPIPSTTRCTFLQGLSPDGTRWWSIGLSVVGDRLVGAPSLAAGATGVGDPRLIPLFFEKMGATDGMWLDNNHLLLIAQKYKPGAAVGRQVEELCAVPVTGQPTCATVKDLGPYERQDDNGNGPSIGPDVLLARPIGQ